MRKLIPFVLLVAALSGFYYFRFLRKPLLSPQKAAEKAIEFINKNMLQGATASLVNVSEEGGVYKFRLKINEQEFDSYVTKDGKLLFTQGIDLNQQPQVAGAQEQKEIPKTDKPEVKLFVMSFCPYGNQAEEIAKPVVDLLKDVVDIEVRYVIYENYGSGYPEYCLDKEKKYCSMHGINEFNQDIRELCVYRQQKDKFWDFVLGVNKDCSVSDVETCWKKVAQKTGINAAAVSACQKTNAAKFAEEEKQLNKKYEVSGSPTLVINGVQYTGPRTSEDYKKAICGAFNNPPEVCNQTLSSSTSAASGGCQ